MTGVLRALEQGRQNDALEGPHRPSTADRVINHEPNGQPRRFGVGGDRKLNGDKQVTDFPRRRLIEVECSAQPVQHIDAGDHAPGFHLGDRRLTNAGPLSQSSTRQTSLRTQSPKTCPKHPHPLAPFTPHTQGSTPRADGDQP
ncbi:hypothetical protein SALBM217S_08288 [Streptomyces griseoloalbus]